MTAPLPSFRPNASPPSCRSNLGPDWCDRVGLLPPSAVNGYHVESCAELTWYVLMEASRQYWGADDPQEMALAPT